MRGRFAREPKSRGTIRKNSVILKSDFEILEGRKQYQFENVILKSDVGAQFRIS